jgi:hypothetical protein
MTTATEADIQIESSNALRRASTANPKRSIRPVKQRSPSADCPGHLFSAHSLRFSVVSLEGIRELQSLNAHSDKTALKRRFDHKQLISPVRTHNIVAQHPPRAGTVVPSLAPDLRQSA